MKKCPCHYLLSDSQLNHDRRHKSFSNEVRNKSEINDLLVIIVHLFRLLLFFWLFIDVRVGVDIMMSRKAWIIRRKKLGSFIINISLGNPAHSHHKSVKIPLSYDKAALSQATMMMGPEWVIRYAAQIVVQCWLIKAKKLCVSFFDFSSFIWPSCCCRLTSQITATYVMRVPTFGLCRESCSKQHVGQIIWLRSPCVIQTQQRSYSIFPLFTRVVYAIFTVDESQMIFSTVYFHFRLFYN